MIEKLNNLYNKSKRIKIDDNTKIVIMSDCHRGKGNNYDNFLKNRNIYNAALNYYYNNDYTYIELGDGDDMWEVKEYQNIINEHINTFNILKKFNDSNRLIMIYGNHDIVKKDEGILSNYFYYYKTSELLNNLKVYESIILEYNNHDLFLLHGHQVDILSGMFWKLARFLVRYLWRPLEHLGIHDPTSAAGNNIVRNKIEKRLKKWTVNNKKILISGHTHRAIYPEVGKSLYFNDGSCIHPNGISCLEIENGCITLVKWYLDLEDEKYITAKRKIIAGQENINNFFSIT